MYKLNNEFRNSEKGEPRWNKVILLEGNMELYLAYSLESKGSYSNAKLIDWTDEEVQMIFEEEFGVPQFYNDEEAHELARVFYSYFYKYHKRYMASKEQ